ncbi:MAG: hypothetical protein ACT4N2_00905 [Hyphomicrobium sp.]
MSSTRVVEKIMSATAAEFGQSLGVLLGRAASCDELPLLIPLGSVGVTIRREPLDGVLLGGLLALPRARVTLTFEGVDEADCAAFLRRFDIAFQRGGG